MARQLKRGDKLKIDEFTVYWNRNPEKINGKGFSNSRIVLSFEPGTNTYLEKLVELLSAEKILEFYSTKFPPYVGSRINELESDIAHNSLYYSESEDLYILPGWFIPRLDENRNEYSQMVAEFFEHEEFPIREAYGLGIIPLTATNPFYEDAIKRNQCAFLMIHNKLSTRNYPECCREMNEWVMFGEVATVPSLLSKYISCEAFSLQGITSFPLSEEGPKNAIKAFSEISRLNIDPEFLSKSLNLEESSLNPVGETLVDSREFA